MFHALIAWPTYRLWDEYIRSGRMQTGDGPILLWPVVVAYVLLPLILGTAVGHGTKGQKRWASWLSGHDPAPKAWDYFFGLHPRGWVRLKLKSGIWIGGVYMEGETRKSYASGYPEPQDLFLINAVEMDPQTGRILRQSDGSVRVRDSSILLRWEEVEYLEFIEA